MKASGKISNLAQVATRFARAATAYTSDNAGLLEAFTSGEIAARMAGTADRKSNAYKAAMRSIQRYKKGTRKASGEQAKKITKAARAIAKESPERLVRIIGPIKVRLSGRIGYSSDVRQRTISADFDALSAAEFIRLARDEESADDAIDMVFTSYLEGMYLETGEGKVTIETAE